MRRMVHEIDEQINKFYPGSRLLILPPEVESIRHIDESDLNKAGWFKKTS